MKGLSLWHRRLGLAVAALWLVQALAGTALVFRWELDDAALHGADAAFDPSALAARVAGIADGGGRVGSIWSSADAATRWDIHYVTADGHDRTLRVNGAGAPLRETSDDALFSDGAVWSSLTTLHTSLFAGEFGEWLIAISGVLLGTNLLLGLKLAWPRAGQWSRALLTRPVGTAAARFYGWHRLLGLWLGVPALLLVSAGILLAFDSPVESALRAAVPPPERSAVATGDARIDVGRAITVALDRYPGATLSGLSMPGDDTPWYRIRVRAPGEMRRNWGTTHVYVAATDGAVLRTDDARTTHAGRRVYDVLYPLHTGQIGGAFGRGLALAIGAWLTLMIVLGLRLHLARRRPR